MLSQISSFYFLNLNHCFISAHITLNHQREIRYRCKNCPLTFLKKKAFVLHHREKHKESIEPWCPLCFEIFDGLKQREDHNCGKIENTGRITICHKHDPPLEFRWVVIVIFFHVMKTDKNPNLRKKPLFFVEITILNFVKIVLEIEKKGWLLN